MAKHSSSKNAKKKWGIVALVAVLVLIIGVVAYQALQTQQDNTEKRATSTQSTVSKGSKTSESQSSSSATQVSSSSSSRTASSASASSSPESNKSWSELSPSAHEAIFAQWVQNAQGKYDVYTGEANLVYLVNRGANGVASYDDPVDVIQNTARVLAGSDGNSYSLQVANPAQTGLRMMQNPWPVVDWQTKEQLTTAQLTEKYGSNTGIAAGTAQIQSVQNTPVPTGNS